MLFFSPENGTAPQCFSCVNDDFVLENTETLDVLLFTSDGAVVLNPALTTIFILDNDSRLYYFICLS